MVYRVLSPGLRLLIALSGHFSSPHSPELRRRGGAERAAEAAGEAAALVPLASPVRGRSQADASPTLSVHGGALRPRSLAFTDSFHGARLKITTRARARSAFLPGSSHG